MSSEQVNWFCPTCDHRNTDLPSQTAIPMCGMCGQNFDWWELELEPMEEQEAQREQ